MYYLYCFIAFSVRSGRISLDMCINKVLISCTTIHDYNQAHMKAEKICYKMVIKN